MSSGRGVTGGGGTSVRLEVGAGEDVLNLCELFPLALGPRPSLLSVLFSSFFIIFGG